MGILMEFSKCARLGAIPSGLNPYKGNMQRLRFISKSRNELRLGRQTFGTSNRLTLP